MKERHNSEINFIISFKLYTAFTKSMDTNLPMNIHRKDKTKFRSLINFSFLLHTCTFNTTINS